MAFSDDGKKYYGESHVQGLTKELGKMREQLRTASAELEKAKTAGTATPGASDAVARLSQQVEAQGKQLVEMIAREKKRGEAEEAARVAAWRENQSKELAAVMKDHGATSLEELDDPDKGFSNDNPPLVKGTAYGVLVTELIDRNPNLPLEDARVLAEHQLRARKHDFMADAEKVLGRKKDTNKGPGETPAPGIPPSLAGRSLVDGSVIRQGGGIARGGTNDEGKLRAGLRSVIESLRPGR